MAEKCTIESHEKSKLDDAQWYRHTPWFPQFDGEQWLDLRNCHCMSTLARPFEGLRIERFDESVRVSLPRQIDGGRVLLTAMAMLNDGQIAVMTNATSDPVEVAALTLIAATEIRKGGNR